VELTTSAFAPGAPIPRRHSCQGEDVSPPLDWRDVPAEAVSLALIVDDPDAPGGTFTHWLAWGIDPASGRLAEAERPPGEGRNDFGQLGYRGPCPPAGHGAHRYFFRLYALDRELAVRSGRGRRDLERAMKGCVLDVAELVGTYRR
jgi:Raf kinase inhibitor-like YbhB/YbcL family protein